MSTPTTTTTQASASPGGPRVSKLAAAKAGFVIPKNKLSGSLVPVLKGAKKPGSTDGDSTVNEEKSVNKVQRKTKWGPDLTQDAIVIKGRVLAYQTRLDQIAEQLKSGALEGVDQDSELADQHDDQRSSNPQADSEKLKFLELEKRDVIDEILKLNPSYQTPPDYKPPLKEAIVPIPIKEYRGYNFLGLVFGPASDTQKRLEKETGATIQVYATKADTGEKVEISPSDGNIQSTYEELYINISADTYEKVDAAADLIELLVTSVSDNLAAISTSTLVSGENVGVVGQGQEGGNPFMAPVVAVNQAVAPVVGQMQTPPQAQFQYHSSWFPSGPLQAPMHPLSSSASIPTNPVNMPSLFGPRPATAAGFTPPHQNPPLVPQNSQLQMQVPPRPYMPQIHPLGHTGPLRNFPMPTLQPSSAQPQPTGSLPMGRPLIPSLPQAASSIPPRPLPDQPLTPTGSSSGWSGAPTSAAASLGSSNMGQLAPVMVAHQGLRPVVSQPGIPSIPVPNMSAGNMISPSFPSGPSTPQSSSTAVNRPAGLVFASGPAQPASSPAFPASAPFQSSPLVPMAATSVPSISQPLSSVSRSTPNFSNINPPSATGSRPQHPSSVDFTFQHNQPLNLAPLTAPRPSSQPAMLNTLPHRPMTQLTGPQAPSFQLTGPNAAAQPVMKGFSRPQLGNQMGQPRAPALPLSRNPTAAFPNASPVPTSPVPQMRPRNFGTGPQLPNFAGPFPPRPGNPLQLQQNYPLPTNRPENHMGLTEQFSNNRPFTSIKLAPNPRGVQIYDPFSPTSGSIRPQQQGANPARARKQQETDPEYEDLMASVGVK